MVTHRHEDPHAAYLRLHDDDVGDEAIPKDGCDYHPKPWLCPQPELRGRGEADEELEEETCPDHLKFVQDHHDRLFPLAGACCTWVDTEHRAVRVAELERCPYKRVSDESSVCVERRKSDVEHSRDVCRVR